jgi:hypothetical protein
MAMFNPIDPRISIIAHDVGRSRDRSTAVVGGYSPSLSGSKFEVKKFIELPLGLYGSALVNALAAVDQDYNADCVIIADLTNDATYGETLFDRFGPRVQGVQIGASGDGTTWAQRPVRNDFITVYNVGRTYLLDLLRDELRDGRIRLPDTANSRRAYDQLMKLEVEQRPNGIVYKCPSGQHDDLAISLAMLAWAARHLHLEWWMRPIFDARRPHKPKECFNWAAVT